MMTTRTAGILAFFAALLAMTQDAVAQRACPRHNFMGASIIVFANQRESCPDALRRIQGWLEELRAESERAMAQDRETNRMFQERLNAEPPARAPRR